MFEVNIYTETSVRGPGIREGKCAAIVEFTKSDGQSVTREVVCKEYATTFHRSTLLASVKALILLNRKCVVHIYTQDIFTVNTIQRGCIEQWRREEWRKSSGDDVKNKELWQQLAELMEAHEVTFVYTKENKYRKELMSLLKRKEE